VAIQEFSVDKKGRNDRRGRSDLWVQSLRGSEYVEAKDGGRQDAAWKDLVGDSLGFLAEAVGDASLVKPDGDRPIGKVGITFVTLQTYAKDKEGRRQDQQIRMALDSIHRDQGKVGMVAWCFPKLARTLKADPKKDTYISGVLILGDLVKSPRGRLRT
jgi:hypothetical protein